MYFMRCTGIHANSLEEVIKVNKSSRKAKVGDMKKVPLVRSNIPTSIPEAVPFEIRFAIAVLKGWDIEDEARVQYVKGCIENKRASCSRGGFGVKSAMPAASTEACSKGTRLG